MNKHYCPYCMSPVPEGESCLNCGLTAGTYIPAPHHLPPGTILLGRYLIGRVLEEGGFGITYIGRDLRLELKVAIKEYYPVDRATRNSSASLEVTSFIGPSSESYKSGKQKFLSEAQVMARMDKQQVIVSVRDFFEVNNTAYIVMEYIDGITFSDLVKRKGGKIDPEDMFPIIEPLFHALTTLHENGLIHRDISPDNLMLENGNIRLLDFGCAREAATGTETMTIALKHGYAPLEQYQQKGQGPWTDIYALCATIYYCLTGKVPPQILDRIAEDSLLIPSKLGINLTVEQEQALLKGMRIQPNRRFSTVEELRAALYQDIPKPEPKPKPEPEPELELETKPEPEPKSETKPEPEPNPIDKKKLFFLAGISVICIAAIIGIAVKVMKLGISNNNENNIINSNIFEDSDLFANACIFTSGDAEEFQALMEDDSVSAVIIDFMWYPDSEITITKPVKVVSSEIFSPAHLTITETGYLQVDGALAIETGYVRLIGDCVRLCISKDGDCFSYDNSSLIWMDDSACLVNLSSNEICAHTLVFSEDSFKNAVSVKDFSSLQEAAEKEQIISIDADFELEDDVYFSAPVRISEGVTLTSAFDNQKDTEPHRLGLTEDTALINKGTFCGSVNLWSSCTAINNTNGSILDISSDNSYFSPNITLTEEASFINLGTMDTGHLSFADDNSLFMNINTLNIHDFCLMGGDMVNHGSITVLPDDRGFELSSGSILMNQSGAALLITAGGKLINKSKIMNEGEFTVKQSGIFWNAVTENNGIFQVNPGADVSSNVENGIYYGYGEFSTGTSNIQIHKSNSNNNPMDYDNLVQVISAEELKEALEDPEASAVYIKGDITIDIDLTVHKNLFIDGSLTFTDGTVLRNYGSIIEIGENSSLQGDTIFLYNDARIHVTDFSVLTINKGGTLSLDNSILCGCGGNIRISGASLILDNKSFYVMDNVSSYETENCEILLKNNSMFVPSSANGSTLTGAAITLNDSSCFYCTGNTDLENCSLNIAESSRFLNSADISTLKNCTLEIDTDSDMLSSGGSLSLIGNSLLNNYGNVQLSGYNENNVFTLDGVIANMGNLYFHIETVLNGSIDNQGTVQYNDEYTFNSSQISGNKPVDKE